MKELEKAPKEYSLLKKVCWYHDHPIYGLCFDDVNCCAGHLNRGVIPADSVEQIINLLYSDAIDYSNQILSHPLSKVAFENVRNDIHKKYIAQDGPECWNKGERFLQSVHDRGILYFGLILIFCHDGAEQLTEDLCSVLRDCREWMEHNVVFWPDLNKRLQMWKPICERVPKVNIEQPEDIKARIDTLEKELAQYHNNTEVALVQTGKRNQEKIHKVTAHDICEYVNSLDFYNLTRDDMKKILAFCTGLSPYSFSELRTNHQ